MPDRHDVAAAAAHVHDDVDLLVSGRNVVLTYGEHVAVAVSTFTVPAAAVTAIIGPNGSGKSTLLHCMAGLIQPRSGELVVAAAKGRRLAYVMQSVAAQAGVPITVRAAVGMGRYASLGWWRPRAKADRERVEWAMRQLDVADLADRHLSELSAGQRQRVFVAQGIAQDHDALLLDEPLTGLDLVSARTIDAIIHNEHARGHAVVLTTHDLEEARAADHVILMAGRVIDSGPPDQVLMRANLETAYGLGALHGDLSVKRSPRSGETAGRETPGHEDGALLDDPFCHPASAHNRPPDSVHPLGH